MHRHRAPSHTMCRHGEVIDEVMAEFSQTVHGVIFILSFVAVVSSSYDTGGCEACPQVGNFHLFALVYLTQELVDSGNLWSFLLCYTFMGRQLLRKRTLLCPMVQVIQLSFSLYSIHNLMPVALRDVHPPPRCITYTCIVTHSSSSQPFLCTVLWHNNFFPLAKSMWWLQKRTLGRSNFSAQRYRLWHKYS